MGIIETIKMIEREEAFEKGFKVGLEKARKYKYEQAVVSNMLNLSECTVSEIANYVNVSESFVRKVKKELKK